LFDILVQSQTDPAGADPDAGAMWWRWTEMPGVATGGYRRFGRWRAARST
jgi:hypothetical protein